MVVVIVGGIALRSSLVTLVVVLVLLFLFLVVVEVVGVRGVPISTGAAALQAAVEAVAAKEVASSVETGKGVIIKVAEKMFMGLDASLVNYWLLVVHVVRPIAVKIVVVAGRKFKFWLRTAVNVAPVVVVVIIVVGRRMVVLLFDGVTALMEIK